VNENTITRETAVGLIRRKMIAMAEKGKSACQIAAENNILCRCFYRDTDDDLRWRYSARIPGALGMARPELESRANAWQLERQQQEGSLLCCDVQSMCYETCRAWDDFTNDELARFCKELPGGAVGVTGKVSLPVL
jgi:hypothetical protein